MGSKNKTKTQQKEKRTAQSSGWVYFNKHKETYMFLVPGLILVILFCYIPLAGLSVAFLDYNVFKGMASPFVGFENFKNIFTMPEFTRAIWNTALLGILNVVVKFPMPILFALMLNELKNGLFKRFTQTVSYLPHFISTIAVVGLASSMFSTYGIVNDIRVALGGEGTERLLFLTFQDWFVPMNVGLTIWKTIGWSAVIYLATISGIDPGLYEAAIIDGAGRFKQCIHITIPSILGTVVILLILEIGNLFRSNFDMIYGLQNAFIDFEVISTVVYKQGIEAGDYSTSTALSLMEGVMSLILVLGTNYFSKKVNDTSIV